MCVLYVCKHNIKALKKILTCAMYGVLMAPSRAAAEHTPSANALTRVGYTSGVYT